MASRFARALLRRAAAPVEDAAEAALARLSEAAVHAPLVDIEAHRIELVAATALRDRGLDVPVSLAAFERHAAVTTLVAPAILTEIRRVCDGRILLMKGPEVAAHYPSPALRGYTDLDILVEDAAAVH